MDSKELKKIFLSASIPLKERHKKYYDTADILAIRDSVRALATVIIPSAHLIWGGHPSINPLIYDVVHKLNSKVQDHVTLYLSNYFKDIFPPDINNFGQIKFVEALDSLDKSLDLMRFKMIEENKYMAGIFIGGMDGVEDEYKIFVASHPDALVLPIASTGAAAKIIYEKHIDQFSDQGLLNDYAYMSLFRRLLKIN